ncbi:MAG TPA: glycoside hydrolase family protein [Thermodesulfobacteriota bacterium]|nr:glycoside hydrolase family protein [Thermodesulfobacteriota bacterium]
MNIQRIIDRLKNEEGFRPVAYWDRKQWTYGYGCKAPGEGATITEPEAEKLLWRHVLEAVGGFVDLFLGCPTPINEVRQECLVDMIFNLGEDGVRKFRQMVEDIMDKDPDDWQEIAEHATESLWYGQVGTRAERIVAELRTGIRQAA